MLSFDLRRLAVLMMRLSPARGHAVNLALDGQYWERLKEKAAHERGFE